MRLIDTDNLKFPNIAIFDMKLHGVTVPMVRLLDLKKLMPSVDATPVVHGRWIGWNYPGDEHIECSICKQQYYEDDLYIGGNDFPKYCPNCGAKMDLKEENK